MPAKAMRIPTSAGASHDFSLLNLKLKAEWVIFREEAGKRCIQLFSINILINCARRTCEQRARRGVRIGLAEA